MSKYVTDTEELRKAIALLGYVDGKLENLSKRITATYYQLESQKSSEADKARSEIKAQGSLYDLQWENILSIKAFLEVVLNETLLAEEKAKADMEKEYNIHEENRVPSRDESAEKEQIGNVNTQQNENSLYQRGKYYNDIVADKSDIWRLDYSWGCTWHTAKKLSMLGVEYMGPFGNGVSWVTNMPEGENVNGDWDIDKYWGNGWYESLLAANGNKPIYNVVLSFETNTTAGLEYCGHVMMIDAIIDGKVYFTDTAWAEEKVLSINEFKSLYATYNGNCIGAAHFHK